MVQRISNLPDGCNRLDEPWTREHINGYETHEEYILNDCFFETITKENFTRIMVDEIKDVELKEGEIEFLLQRFRKYPKANKKKLVKHYVSVCKDKGDKMEVKIEAQIVHKPKVPVDETIDWCVDERNKGMTCIGCGQCEEIVCFTPDGALSGQEIVALDIESNNILRRLKKERQAQKGEISWWEIYSTQQKVNAAVARMKHAHRTKIVKIEMDIVIN